MAKTIIQKGVIYYFDYKIKKIVFKHHSGFRINSVFRKKKSINNLYLVINYMFIYDVTGGLDIDSFVLRQLAQHCSIELLSLL